MSIVYIFENNIGDRDFGIFQIIEFESYLCDNWGKGEFYAFPVFPVFEVLVV